MVNPFEYFALAAMREVQQCSCVDYYYTHVKFLRTFCLSEFPYIYDEYFLSQFINGLKREIQLYVLQHHPSNLLDAYELALIQEYTLKCVEQKEHKLENTSITVAVVESTFVTEFEVTGDPDDVDDHSVAGDCTVPCYAMELSRDSEQIQDTRRGVHSSHFTQSSLENNPLMAQYVVANVLADGGSPESAAAATITFESVLEPGAKNVVAANDMPLQCSFSDSIEHAFSVMVIDSLYIHSAGRSDHHSSKEVSLLINDNEASYEGTTLSHSVHVLMGLSLSALSHFSILCDHPRENLACFAPGIAPMPPDRLFVSFRGMIVEHKCVALVLFSSGFEPIDECIGCSDPSIFSSQSRGDDTTIVVPKSPCFDATVSSLLLTNKPIISSFLSSLFSVTPCSSTIATFGLGEVQTIESGVTMYPRYHAGRQVLFLVCTTQVIRRVYFNDVCVPSPVAKLHVMLVKVLHGLLQLFACYWTHIACFFSMDTGIASNDLMHQFIDFLVIVCIEIPGYCRLDIALTVQIVPILVLREIYIGVPMANSPKVLFKLTLPGINIFHMAYVGHQDARTTYDCKVEDVTEIAVLKDRVFDSSSRVSAAAVKKYAKVRHHMGLTEWSASVPSIQPKLNSLAFANFEGVGILERDIIYNVGTIVSRHRYVVVLYVICFDPGIVQSSFMCSIVQTPIVF